MPAPKKYTVVDAMTGATLAVGSAEQCAKKTGLSANTIRGLATGHNSSYKYEVTAEETLAAQWDAFRKPICERFGIPYYTSTKGGAGQRRSK